MLRIRAVEEMLVGDVAGVRVPPDETPPEPALDAARERRRQARYELDRARRKALSMALLCLAAVAILFVTHESPMGFLAVERENLVFTMGILLITGYGGYRVGQWEKLKAVERVMDDLAERSEG